MTRFLSCIIIVEYGGDKHKLLQKISISTCNGTSLPIEMRNKKQQKSQNDNEDNLPLLRTTGSQSTKSSKIMSTSSSKNRGWAAFTSSGSPTRKKVSTVSLEGKETEDVKQKSKGKELATAQPLPPPRGRSFFRRGSRLKKKQDPPASNEEKKEDEDAIALSTTTAPMPHQNREYGGDHQTATSTLTDSMATSTYDDGEDNGSRALPTPQTTATSSIRELLGRPLDRTILQEHQSYHVQVSAPEWDTDHWNYRIVLQQKRHKVLSNSLTQAIVHRQLADFFWFEKELQKEFGGALLVPLLSIALGTTADDTAPVASDKLREWLSDIFNGIRGQGELLLRYPDLLKESETVEAFLYKHDLQSSENDRHFQGVNNTNTRTTTSSILPELLLSPLQHCIGTAYSTTDDPKGFAAAACSSRALATARSLEVLDSFADEESTNDTPHRQKQSFQGTTPYGTHAEYVEALKFILLASRKNALSCLESMHRLSGVEENIGAAWKRLAIALSNLFAYEKDAEHKSDSVLYRKISKRSIDDALRVLAKAKICRSMTSFAEFLPLLNAYLADVSTVEPSIEAYNGSLLHLRNLEASIEEADTTTIQNWEERWKILSLSGVDSDKLQKETQKRNEALQERQRFVRQVQRNEPVLRDSLTRLYESHIVRSSRMAFQFWRSEANQAATVHSAAAALREHVTSVSSASLAKVLRRHEEHADLDMVTELQLLHRMLDLKDSRFQTGDALSGASIDQTTGVEVDTDTDGRKEVVFDLARSRNGRWDAELSMAIMKAIGIDDPNIRVEEAPRDLRTVRKYAVGLRENLYRCVEALDVLKETYSSQENTETNEPQKLRKAFFVEMAKLFGGHHDTFGSGESRTSRPSLSELKSAGIDIDDHFGWDVAYSPNLNFSTSNHDDGRLGDLLMNYLNSRDSQLDWLFDMLSEKLHEYFLRVEAIDGIVYMECVGIQFEKHFNELRSKTLEAFEKKTDITSALNIAKKKKLDSLIVELDAKMGALGSVSQLTVKATKEQHLESKTIRSALHKLASRRLDRLKELSTQNIVDILAIWSKEEETVAATELKALGEALAVLETQVHEKVLHSFAKKKKESIRK